MSTLYRWLNDATEWVTSRPAIQRWACREDRRQSVRRLRRMGR